MAWFYIVIDFKASQPWGLGWTISNWQLGDRFVVMKLVRIKQIVLYLNNLRWVHLYIGATVPSNIKGDAIQWIK